MPHMTSRPIAIAASALAAATVTAALAAPAFASGRPTTKPTSLTLRASKGTVAPRHKVLLTATLKSGHTPLANQTLCLEERAKAGTTKAWGPWGTCVDLSPTTDANGQVVVTGVVPVNKKGTKDQYKVVFMGATGYAASHSAIITVTTS